MTTGILWQVAPSAARLPSVEQARRAIAAVADRTGRRPVAVQVRPGEWPEEIDGVRVIPTTRMSYPTVMLMEWGEAA